MLSNHLIHSVRGGNGVSMGKALDTMLSPQQTQAAPRKAVDGGGNGYYSDCLTQCLVFINQSKTIYDVPEARAKKQETLPSSC